MSMDTKEITFSITRAILIFLVVFGHMIQPYTSESKYLSALYLLIYNFHMPSFYLSLDTLKHLDKPHYLENVAKS